MKKFFILNLLSVVLLLSGCSLPFGGNDAGEQGQEVALGQECGMDGLKCCENEPSCLYGQICCADPNGSTRNRCADTCACGSAEEFCCAGAERCKPCLGCFESVCLACGGENEPCCESQSGSEAAGSCPGRSGGDNSKLVCAGKVCVTCGLPGNPCCAFEPRCLERTAPAELMSECLGGTCVACGGDGERVCLGARECYENFLSSNGRCYRCGGINQPCCRDKGGKDICLGQDALTCDLGFCRN